MISDTQAAFVEGRQIFDVILVAFEVMGKCKALRKEGFLLKLDLEKAYDKITWAYLDVILELKGYGRRWRKTTKNFVNFIYY